MKQSRLMVFCIFLLLTMLGLLFFSGAIYDAEKKFSIDTFFFEPNSHSAQRILPPVSADDIPDKNLREWLIRRFVHEYFYVIPYTQNATARAEKKDANGRLTTLYGLSRPAVFKDWVDNMAPQIIEMAERNVLRSVQVLPDITENKSGYLVVKYTLKTWDKPNDVLAQPTVQNGVLYIHVTPDPIHVLQTEQALDDLKNGEDPVSAFNFEVINIEQH